MTKPIPKYCNGCTYLSTTGIKNGKHDRWCCRHSGPAPDKVAHCKLVGGKLEKEITPADVEQLARIAAMVDKVDPYEVPDGWKLVPIEPTEHMRSEGRKTYQNDGDEHDIWLTMIAAAPEYEELK